MRHTQKNIVYRLFMAALCILIGIGIPLIPAIAYAGGINVPSISDDFYKPQEGPKPEEQKPINDENTKVETPEQKQQQQQNKKEEKKDGPDTWAVAKFMINDFVKEQAASVEPYISNPMDEISPKGAIYGNMVKIPRAAMGNLYFKDGSAGKIIIDTWDGAEKSVDAWSKYKDLKEIRNLQNQLRNTHSLAEKAEIQSQIGKLRSVSKLSKGVGGVGLAVAGIDFYKNVTDVFKNWQAGKGGEARDAAIKAVGSIGEGLISAGTILGPTPWGVGLTAAGAVLWIGSAAWTHREGIKKIAQKTADVVSKGYNAVKNGVKSAWNKLFG